jgi:predicted O-methyltransferase YrrM
MASRLMEEYLKFIMDHAHSDVNALRLQYHGKSMPFSVDDACMQIEMRRKTAGKLPWFLHHPGFRFGTAQSAEQASNQNVALFHAFLIGHNRSMLDMTAGLGIDAMTIAMRGNRVTAFELETKRVEALRHNADILGIDDLTVVKGDSVLHLQQSEEHYDWIFVDPARRDSGNNRCFLLQDSLPDVVSHQDLLLAHADNVLIKASPLLDITQTLRDFSNVRSIIILSYKNEVKEVLIHLSLGSAPLGSSSPLSFSAVPEGEVKLPSSPLIQAIDLADGAPAFPDGAPAVRFRFIAGGATQAAISYATSEAIAPGIYLYEAGAAMRKLQCASQICARYTDIKSLAKDSGLFVSETLHADFPGRICTVKAILSAKQLKALKDNHCRVVSSCYPMSAADLRKKFRLKEGEDMTLYATTTRDGLRIMILATS